MSGLSVAPGRVPMLTFEVPPKSCTLQLLGATIYNLYHVLALNITRKGHRSKKNNILLFYQHYILC